MKTTLQEGEALATSGLAAIQIVEAQDGLVTVRIDSPAGAPVYLLDRGEEPDLADQPEVAGAAEPGPGPVPANGRPDHAVTCVRCDRCGCLHLPSGPCCCPF